MDMFSPGLATHRGLRGQLLVELKRDQPLSAKELAERHGVSANAVRRHLKELELEGLVRHDREQRGHGAPTYTYRLTEQAEALFPKRYDEALTDVLTYLARADGRQAVERIFAQRFRAHADRLKAELAGASFEERVAAVAQLLTEQGFMAEWSAGDGEARIAEHNCAVQAAARRFPEICAAEAAFLRDVLGADVKREAYIPAGCNACEYAVTLTATGAPTGVPEVIGKS